MRKIEPFVAMSKPSESVPMNVETLLEECRRGLQRLEPEDALRDSGRGGLLVDMRPVEQRTRDGLIPGAIAVDRNVLEWRLDPQSEHRLSCITGHDQQIILICNEGYGSSLAAATLQRLGLRNATDVIGGFQEWAARGLPVSSELSPPPPPT
jgi:rhodanese-related sulfurtransferase